MFICFCSFSIFLCFSKLELLLLVEANVNSEYENGDKRIFVYVDIDDEKILVKDKVKFQKIVENYLITNRKKFLVPMTIANPLVKNSKPYLLREH
jgi:hypothetical protein